MPIIIDDVITGVRYYPGSMRGTSVQNMRPAGFLALPAQPAPPLQQ
jgi:hypothetical protein